ncbi:hypothetical protein C8Q78DRAFT_530281 [Trametes maxima]|nr:hypothetical protein C8Q78DRAFT_530281 [Trametes maxima]
MSQDSSDSVRAFVTDVAPVDDKGRVVCFHNLPAKRVTSRSPANPERDFYACSSDRDSCKFFVWTDDPTLCSVIQSRTKSRKSTPNMLPSTPQRPSQARRAFFARSPTLAAASLQKRLRTPSLGQRSSSTDDRAVSVKHRRVESTASSSVPAVGLTPATSYPKHTKHVSGSQSASQDAKKAARLRSIQEALLSATETPSPCDPSPASSGEFFRRENTRRASPSRQHSDVPLYSTPPSLSQNLWIPQNLPRYAQDTESDDGASTYIENELAEMEDMESKAVQTSPVDDESSIMEDFWSASPARSVLGSPVLVADTGIGSSRASQHPPALGVEHTAWSPASPRTPGRAGLPRASAPGGSGSDDPPGMLLTPPGSSQPPNGLGTRAGPSVPQRGTTLLQEMLASPSAAKGKGPAHAPSQQQWQPLQDDPENPFRGPTLAHRAISPASTAISVADGPTGGTPADALSADSIASHLAALQDLPEYIAKLERRERASRKSAEIKGRKISQLEEELQRLRNEKRALEETVAALQMRR